MYKKTLCALILSLGVIAVAQAQEGYVQITNTKIDPALKKATFIKPTETTIPTYEGQIPGEEAFMKAVDILKEYKGSAEGFNEAFKFFKQSADEGNYLAQREVGTFYMKGEGVKQNSTLGLEYLNKASAQGDSVSDVMLGATYVKGWKDIKPNFETANTYFEKAVLRDHDKKVLTYIGQTYLQAGDVGPTFAIPWLERAAAAGDTNGAYLLARCYLEGVGTPFNEAKGMDNLNKAVAVENPFAMTELGKIYEKGLFGKKKNLEKAYLLYTLSVSATPEAAEGQTRVGKELKPAQIKKVNHWMMRLSDGLSIQKITN